MKAQSPRQLSAMAFMARHPVAANILMALLLVGGVAMTPLIKQEVFPEVSGDRIAVQVLYPGASPEEVEEGVILAIEEAVSGLDGVDRVRSTASEGVASVMIELVFGADTYVVLNDVQAAIDRVSSFPADAERPVISVPSNRSQVISLVLHGRVGEEALRDEAERVRRELLADPRITLVELTGVRPREISIEISQSQLRSHGLSLTRVAQTVAASSIELPGGRLKADSGEVMLRTVERRDDGEQFADITLLSAIDGTHLRLGDVATVVDGFADVDRAAFFDGEPAVRIDVFRVGDGKPIEIADAVKEYLAKTGFSAGISAAIWNDSSEIFEQRIELLLDNAYLGLSLVLLLLGLLLNIRLAFWVSVGIGVSLAGALLLMPLFGVSLNMISLFAFILTIGIVVDDAIVVGEAVYAKRQQGLPPLEAAIAGLKEVASPVVFSVLTTIAAFSPLLFVPGVGGKFFAIIPAIVIAVLLISLVESLFILPAHLVHSRWGGGGLLGFVERRQAAFSAWLQALSMRIVGRSVGVALRWRYATVAAGVALLIVTVGYVASGRMAFSFLPRIEGDVVVANLRLPVGTPVEQTTAMQARLVEAVQAALGELAPGGAARGVYSEVGVQASGGGGPVGAMMQSGGHLAQVSVYLVGAGSRVFSAEQLSKLWEQRMGEVPEAEALTFVYETGPSAGAPIDVALTHSSPGQAESAARELAKLLKNFEGVRNIDDGVRPGKQQLDVRLKPEARELGISELELARQLRAAFFGVEALRQQRDRDELRVYVRLPDEDRRRLETLDEFVLSTPAGGELSLSAAATLQSGVAYTSIVRDRGRRVLNVTADVDLSVSSAAPILERLRREHLPDLAERYPGLSSSFSGAQEEQNKAFSALGRYFVIALFVIFGLMAVPLRSYAQPLIVMAAIPFGVVGAVGGHILLGFELSMMSMFGVVALSGVTVNNGLVLMSTYNQQRQSGESPMQAAIAAVTRRFLPVALTTLTTFLGLAPLIFETSLQARFLIPMAIGLAFGVLFAAVVTLFIVPSMLLIQEDLRALVHKVRAVLGRQHSSPAAAVLEP